MKNRSGHVYSFEYCAARYLDLWLKKERMLYFSVKKRGFESETVKDILRHFAVVRGFPKIGEPSVLAGVTRDINRVIEKELSGSRQGAESMPDALVRAWSKRINSEQLSAATKVLWMWKRNRFVIYDGNVGAALRERGWLCDNSPGYRSYFEAWSKGYAEHRSQLKLAIGKLSEYAPFALYPENTWTKVIERRWFAKRVFDQFLWLEGAGLRKNNVSA